MQCEQAADRLRAQPRFRSFLLRARTAPRVARSRSSRGLPRLLAALPKALYISPLSRALRLAVQDIALSRRKHGFESRRARQRHALTGQLLRLQWLMARPQPP